MLDDELLLEANKWELSHGGLSGRTAQQFIDLPGRNQIRFEKDLTTGNVTKTMAAVCRSYDLGKPAAAVVIILWTC